MNFTQLNTSIICAIDKKPIETFLTPGNLNNFEQ